MKPCPGPWLTPTINWNGDVTVCCIDVMNKIKLGNIAVQPFHEIWNGKKITELRIKHIKGELDDVPPCNGCSGLDIPEFDQKYIIDYLKQIGKPELINYVKEKNPANPCFFNLQLEPTDLCNLNCKMCDQGLGHNIHKTPKGYMEFSLAKKAVEEFQKFNFSNKTLLLQWMGEPLMYPKFKGLISIIKGLKSGSINCLSFVTNGINFDNELAKELASIDTVQHVWVEFSLNAVSEESFIEITGSAPGVFQKVIENIKNYLELIKRKDNFEVGLRFVVMNDNAQEAEDFAEYWKKVLEENGMSYEVVVRHDQVRQKQAYISFWSLLGVKGEADELFKKTMRGLGI